MGLTWFELPDVPEHLEGSHCWVWAEGTSAPPRVDVIPKGYSRDRRHCGGVWVAPIVLPSPPEIKAKTKEAKP